MKNYYFRSSAGCISFEALYWVYYSVKEKCFYMKFYGGDKSFKYASNTGLTKSELEKELDEFQVPHIKFEAKNGDTYYIHLNRFLIYDGGKLYIKSLGGSIEDFDFREECFIQYDINRYEYDDEETENEEATSPSIPEEKEPERKIKAPSIDTAFYWGH